MFDHFSNWKFFFLFLPALFAGSLRSECARKKKNVQLVMFSVHHKLGEKFQILTPCFFSLSLIVLPFLLIENLP